MSTAVLNGLRDYLYGTLSPANMLWLGIQLTEYAKKQQEKSSDFFPPSSTCEELIESAEEGRKRIAAGKDRKSTRLNSSHIATSRMPSSA